MIRIRSKLECENNFYHFVQTAFNVVEPGTTFIGNWHIEAICNHLDAMLMGKIKNLIINIPPGCMKLCSDDTPILTPEGWRTHGELKAGDYVFGQNGEKTKIVKTSEKGEADLLCTFTNGEKIRVNGDHLWDVYDRRCLKTRTMKTSEIMSTRMFSGNRASFLLPNTEPMKFAGKAPSEFDLHPYFVGAWLGDGTSSKPDITSGYQDREVIDVIVHRTGLKPKKRYDHPTQTSSRWAFTNQGVKNRLRELGLIDNKHLPKDQLFGSMETRLQLLAGLVDTDGWKTKDSKLCIGTSNPRLRDDIMTLLNTLAFRPCLIETESPPIDGYDNKNPHWRIQFVPTVVVPCGVERKRCSVIKQRRIGFKSIERVDDGKQGHCITVEASDGLYVVGQKCVVTHNSFLLSVMFPAWVWIHDPTQSFMYSSYDQKLSTRDSVRCRQLIDSEWYQGNWGTRFYLTSDQNEKTKFMNNKSGWRIATSTRGRGMGEHPHWLMVDDANNTAKVSSEADRKYVSEEWWDGAMSSRGRMLKGHHRVCQQQRVHTGDLTGHICKKFGGDSLTLLDPGEWYQFRLPMRYEQEMHCVTPIFEDPRRGQEGALLWEGGFSAELVDTIALEMGPLTAAGQLQQRPTVAGGTLFKAQWLQTIEPLSPIWLDPIFGASSQVGVSHVEISEN